MCIRSKIPRTDHIQCCAICAKSFLSLEYPEKFSFVCGKEAEFTHSCVLEEYSRLLNADGTASFQVDGTSVASAQAHAIAQAYAGAYATAETCHKCSAAMEILVASYAEIFLKATAEASIELEAISHGANVRKAETSFKRSFVNATVVAFAEVCSYLT